VQCEDVDDMHCLEALVKIMLVIAGLIARGLPA
jgi:hypothetical protein